MTVINLLIKHVVIYFAAGCTYSWTTYTGFSVQGLTQQGTANTHTRDSCQQACIASATCFSIDYNNLDKTCWHGTTANPSRNANSAVDHLDLTRNCGLDYFYMYK